MKTLTRYLPILALAAALAPTAATAEFQEGDYRYDVDNGEAIITKYEGPGGDITIPEDLGGHPVRIIGSKVFTDNTTITSVVIPDSVTTIADGDWSGKGAFRNCTALISLTIGNSVTAIGDFAFANCTSLTSVTIPDSVTYIGGSAFQDCTSLTSVLIPDSATTIYDFAFAYCTALDTVTIGNSVNIIGDSAFRNCTALTNVTIPDSVTIIAPSAFKGCTSLASVTIGNSVTTIWDWAFEGCTALTSVTIGESVTTIWDRAFEGCYNITEVTWHCNPFRASDVFLYSYQTITKVVIGSSVTTIGDEAFYGCTSLTRVYFCGPPPTMGLDVFYNAPATLYYLPAHAAQWQGFYTHRPRRLWNPTFTAPALVDGTFSSSVTGTPNIPVAVEARACLLTGVWLPLLTTTIPPSGFLEFTDPDAAIFSSRFYRIVGP